MQFFQNLPPSIKNTLLFLIVIFSLLGFTKLDDFTDFLVANNSEQEEQKINVGFVIRDSDDNPIEGVNVSFQGIGAVETRRTDSDGYVGISLTERQDIEIVMIKEGFKTKRKIINLDIDDKKTVTYYLENEVESNSSLKPKINQTIESISSYISSQEKCQQDIPLDEFIFKIEKCERTGETLIISLTVENIGRPRNITIYSKYTRIIDDVGHDNNASEVYIGQLGWNNSVQIKLPHESSIKAGLKFEDFFIKKEPLLLEINTSISKIEFRNVFL